MLGLLGFSDGPVEVRGQSVQRVKGVSMTVGELADLLTAQSRQYFGALEIPPLQAALDLLLSQGEGSPGRGVLQRHARVRRVLRRGRCVRASSARSRPWARTSA